VSEFDRLVGALDYPMFIVTVADDDVRAGCLVGFAAQCGMSPPRFMVWLSKKNHTFEIAQRVATFAVHIPTAADRALAELFGSETGDTVDKFAGIDWRPGPEGVPLLTDCPQWFVGRVLSREDTGDHVGHLLEPVAVSEAYALGQLPFQSVKTLTPGHEA